MASFPGAIVLNVGMRTIFNNLSVCKGFLAPSPLERGLGVRFIPTILFEYIFLM